MSALLPLGRSRRGFMAGSSAALATYALGAGAQGSGPIKFGISTATSGDAASYGKPFLDAIQLVAGEINRSGGILGRQIEVIHYDDRGVPDLALQAAKKLVLDDKVHTLQPGSTSGAIFTAMPVGKDNKVAMWGYGLAKQWLVQSEGMIFRSAPPDQVMVSALASHARDERKLRRVGILHIDSFYGESARDVFKAAFEAGGSGARIVSIASHPEGNRDVSSQLLKMVQDRVDGVYLSTVGSGVAPVIRQARQFLPNGVIVMGDSQMSDIKVRTELKDLAIGMLYYNSPMNALNPDPLNQRWVQLLQSRLGLYQEIMGRAVVGMTVMKEAIERANSLDAVAVMRQVHRIRDFPTPAGVFTYDPRDGEGLKTGMVVEARAGSDPAKDRVVATVRTDQPIYAERIDFTRFFGPNYRQELYAHHKVS